MAKDVEEIFKRLCSSSFRSNINLSPADCKYYKKKGRETIRQHARDFIAARLAPANPRNDARQTPWQGHPVFTAQHATATCCRDCLASWHNISRGRELTYREMDYIVDIIMKWLSSAKG